MEEQPEEKPIIAEDESPAPSSGLAKIWEQHKRMIIIIGAVVVIGLTFGIMRTLKSHSEPAPAIDQPAAPAVVQAPIAQPVTDPQITDQLTELKQESINNSVATRQLQSQVLQLTNSLNQTRTNQQQLNQSLMVLVGQVQQLTSELKTLSHPKPVKVEAPAPKPVEKVITYQIRAVVPGRAWIVNSDGESQSVAIGDVVPQYGNVQSIDADTGVVITTSGKTIKF